jgi:precorrin-3B C17-methyltransferase
MGDQRGKLLLVGFGPGGTEHMTFRAKSAIEEADAVIGYITYINLIRHLCEGKIVQTSGMTEEVRRAKRAVDFAEEGKTVAMVCSGDSGVYGMAGLVFEVLKERDWDPATGVGIEVVPGASAANACAALVGAPLMHDYCNISLSDLLTPWELITRRVEAAASTDFVIALYNPTSVRRQQQIVECKEIIAKYRGGDTPVAIIRSAYRARQEVTVTELDHMLEYDMGMLATVLVGNSQTFTYKGHMVTPRGYTKKYELDGDGSAQVVKAGQRPGHTLVTAKEETV